MRFRPGLGADIRKLPLADVRKIASDIQNGFPIQREILEKHPWIQGYSQEVVREIYGDRFPVWNFQTLGVFTPPWVGAIQPVTTNPKRMFIQMQGHPTFIWGFTSKTVSQEQIVMRYEITPERVVVYVPALIHAIMDMWGDSLRHWKAEYRKGLHKVFERSLYEHEDEQILADLSGLEPSIMDFRIGKKQWTLAVQPPYVPPGVLEWRPQPEPEPDLGERPGDIWWWDKKLVRDIIAGWDLQGPEAYAKEMIETRQVDLDEEWTESRVIESFKDIYRKIEAFFSA